MTIKSVAIMSHPRSILILVACHRFCRVPADAGYAPILVGAALKDGRQEEMIPNQLRDDEGDSISRRNGLYSELTALYWAWRNLSAAHVGLVHYSRFFAPLGAESVGVMGVPVATSASIGRLLKVHDILLPEKTRLKRGDNLFSHFVRNHPVEAMFFAERALREEAPQYLRSFYDALESGEGYFKNMMAARKDLVDEYASWLFRILFRMERIYEENGIAMAPRLMGHVSERLLNVWIRHHAESLNVAERRIVKIKSRARVMDYGSRLGQVFVRGMRAGTGWKGA